MRICARKLSLLLFAILLVAACENMRAGRNVSNPDAGRVSSTVNMSVARFDHAAALLPNGQVLIVGGISANGRPQPTAELFDPTRGRFSSGGTPLVKRGWGPVAVTLKTGRALIMGGSDPNCNGCVLSDVELYDVGTHTFSRTGSMRLKRAAARAVLLPSGDVLVVGGAQNDDPSLRDLVATAEIYDPQKRTFSPAGQMHISDAVQLVLLKNGQVLVVGMSGAEIYDPASNRFTQIRGMVRPRTKFGAAVLPDGRVLIAGGQTGGPFGQRENTTEIYDPLAGKFTPGPTLHDKRFKLMHAVVPLSNGSILIGGGAEHPEVYDPAQSGFKEVTGNALDGFCFSTATVLGDGRVLLAGGYARPGGEGVNHAWLYTP